MEDFNTDNQDKPTHQASGSSRNKSTAPGKARPSRSGAPATKAAARKAPVQSKTVRKASGGGSEILRGITREETVTVQRPREPTAETETKVMVSEVSEEEVPIENELKKQSATASQPVQPREVRADYIKSVVTQITPLDEEQPSTEETIPQKSTGEKKLRKLEKKSLKAERKVDKLMDKYKQARKDNVKRGKLQKIKDKLIKAFAKLRRRHRKLRKAQA